MNLSIYLSSAGAGPIVGTRGQWVGKANLFLKKNLGIGAFLHARTRSPRLQRLGDSLPAQPSVHQHDCVRCRSSAVLRHAGAGVAPYHCHLRRADEAQARRAQDPLQCLRDEDRRHEAGARCKARTRRARSRPAIRRWSMYHSRHGTRSRPARRSACMLSRAHHAARSARTQLARGTYGTETYSMCRRRA